MLAQAVVEFFKHKVVSSIIVLACWPASDQIKFTRQISQYGMTATFSCDAAILDHVRHHYLQGVLYMAHEHDNITILEQVQNIHFLTKYKWLILGDHVPAVLRKSRYDADIAFLKWEHIASNHTRGSTAISAGTSTSIHIYDAYVHPTDGISINLWAHWTSATGLVLTHERERLLRRLNIRKHPIRIATPVGHYSSERYDGTFEDFLADESLSEEDPGVRSAYGACILITEMLNGQDVMIINELWAAVVKNDSMVLMVTKGEADLTGGILRILHARTFTLDFIMPIWPFRVGFTYLAERESSSNMYLEPFSPAVWWSCLAMMGILALMERITAKSPKEKDGAFYAVLTTWLQQDASAVPEGASGRWTFTVVSVSAMLVHAYYTSAIVSALMSTGRGGPDTLKGLADSKYAIASEDYDYMRYVFFDIKTTWDELEYLKKKKKTSDFYHKLSRGVELIREGGTAFHGEYNQLYPHFKTFSDDQICKLQHVDTIPEIMTWISATKDSQWTNVMRVAGGWLTEIGLAKRLISRLRIPQPPCRASLLAERVKLGDIAPLLVLSTFGAVLSVVLLGVEIMYAKAKRNREHKGASKRAFEEVDEVEAVD